MKFPLIYEINARLFLRSFSESNEFKKINEIPDSFWLNLKYKGFDYIWLMGIWETCDSVIEEACFQPFLLDSYLRVLKDFSKEDVIGSPYAINRYRINPKIATEKEFIEFRTKINKLGLKLILDFVPNHLCSDSLFVKSNPEYFVEATESNYEQDSYTFFKSKYNTKRIFAHAKDPFFPAWTDTIQLNYFNPKTRDFMIENLQHISKFCDGVRCDMAMLVLNNIFQNNWRGIINEKLYPKPETEFWSIAIKSIKNENPDFLFIAEAYWNLEWDLQQLGFDFTYDKKLLDRLKDAKPTDILSHLKADFEYQKNLLRFIENHDELRAVSSLGLEKSLAAAVIVSTIMGMKLFFHGQFEGKKTKTPVQLGREPNEKVLKVVERFYNKLFSIIQDDIFKNGNWQILDVLQAHPNNPSSKEILSWMWSKNEEKRIVIVNYSNQTAQCRLRLPVENYLEDSIEIYDILHEKGYIRPKSELIGEGIFIELGSYQSHILII